MANIPFIDMNIEMNPSVSVIIPVYNSERYLAQCLDSVLGQTLKDIEIICVDDGSADNTPKILSEYAARDERIRIITQGNAGPGIARNNGMKLAKGEYLAFIDSDDFWNATLLETAYRQAKALDVDLCLYPYAVYNESDGSYSQTPYAAWLPRETCFEPKHYGGTLFQMTPSAPGYRLYRRIFLKDNHLEFLPQHIGEDLYFVYLAMAFAGKIGYIRSVEAFLRRGTDSNLSSSLEKYPRETHYAVSAVQSRLHDASLYDILRPSFRIAAISASEYVFQHVSLDILPMEERQKMLAELDLADKSFIAEYSAENGSSAGKIQTLRRMLKTYGADYTFRFFSQTLRK